jgi:starch synthase
MKILLAASEMVPFAKTGGLADVVGALSEELAALGHDVTCVLPFYRSVAETVGKDARPTGAKLTVPVGIKQVNADIVELPLGQNRRVYFVRRDEYFDRSQLYRIPERDYEDNAERFIFFSKIVVSLIHSMNLKPDVVHCHDWQTALVPVFFRWVSGRSANGLPAAPRVPKLVFTIHNLAYQGVFWGFDFPMTNLPAEYFTPEGLEYYGHLNCMKGGILFSDAVTTVSRKYAQEILTPECGFGLEAVLQKRQDRLSGILNGVDYSDWNPETDPSIKSRYNATDLSGKQICKQDLLAEFGLDVNFTGPVIGVVSRLTDQKGFDLIETAMPQLLRHDVKLVVLGEGETHYEEMLRQFAARFPQQVGVRIDFDDALAHKIEAGSDFFLMPSRFEPCGLNQMYSLKYGAIPIVRATGGLDDTIENFDPRTGAGNGFKFADYEAGAMLAKIEEAMAVFAQPLLWRQLQRMAMSSDFSWRSAAQKYVELYQQPL